MLRHHSKLNKKQLEKMSDFEEKWCLGTNHQSRFLNRKESVGGIIRGPLYTWYWSSLTGNDYSGLQNGWSPFFVL